jgi:hypothetical protein
MKYKRMPVLVQMNRGVSGAKAAGALEVQKAAGPPTRWRVAGAGGRLVLDGAGLQVMVMTEMKICAKA